MYLTPPPRDGIRLVTRLDQSVSDRLRLLCVVEGAQIGTVLNGVLDRHLPSAAQLAAELTRRAERSAS